MRQYTFDTQNIYTGFLDTFEETPNSTNVQPESDSHTLWNGSTWELQSVIETSFEQNVLMKIQQARNYFDEIVSGFLSNAAHFEVDTWETQRQEWLAFIQNQEAVTPYCDMLAQTRGISKEILMDKVGYKVVAFANIQGQLHALEDMINSCTNQAELDSVQW